MFCSKRRHMLCSNSERNSSPRAARSAHELPVHEGEAAHAREHEVLQRLRERRARAQRQRLPRPEGLRGARRKPPGRRPVARLPLERGGHVRARWSIFDTFGHSDALTRRRPAEPCGAFLGLRRMTAAGPPRSSGPSARARPRGGSAGRTSRLRSSSSVPRTRSRGEFRRILVAKGRGAHLTMASAKMQELKSR